MKRSSATVALVAFATSPLVSLERMSPLHGVDAIATLDAAAAPCT